MFYELSFTEYNGEQQYGYDYIFEAADDKEANKLAQGYLQNWYADSESKWENEDTVVFLGGAIAVRMESIIQVQSLDMFLHKLGRRFSFNLSDETLKKLQEI